MSEDQKTAVITGAAGAIGGAIAQLLVEDGWEVVGLDLRKGQSSSVEWVVTDVTDSHQLETTAKNLDRCDFLVNAAGFGDRAPAAEMTPAQWESVISGCLSGTFYSCKAFYQQLAARGGVIVNIASAAATNALATHANYCSAKAGVVALTEVLALEWAKEGIRVLAVSPGFVATPKQKLGFETAPKLLGGIEASTPMGRLAEVAEIAEAVVSLAGAQFSYLTGENIVIDGGFSTDGGSSHLFAAYE